MVIDRNILKITITELHHSCDVVERCVRDYGITKPVSWRWEVDEVSRYIWNDACMRVKNPKGLRPSEAASEISALALQEGVIIEAQSNGSLVLRPTRMQLATNNFFGKKVVEFFKPELTTGRVDNEVSDKSSNDESSVIRTGVNLFERLYGIGAPYDSARPLSSLRPFAQMMIHCQLVQKCIDAGKDLVPGARSSYTDDWIGKQLASFIDGTFPVVDLANGHREALNRELFCWLWSGTYPRKLFLELVNQRPKWRWCSVGRDYMLPAEAEVPLRVFQENEAIRALLLLLASSTSGVDLAPLCSLFDEEANLPWYLRTTVERLERIREELRKNGNMELEPSLNLMIDDDFSEAMFLLASLDYEAIRHASSLYVSNFVESVWNAAKAVNRVLARRVCSGKVTVYEPRYAQFIELALSALHQHGDLLGVDLPAL
jgi:hypothetical protein